MSPAQRTVIDDHCTTEWAEKVASPWADFEHAGRAKLAAEPGHEVYTLTPEQTRRLAHGRRAAEGANGRRKVEQRSTRCWPI